MGSELQELKIENAILKVKLEACERLIETLSDTNKNYDMNLKLSLQNGSHNHNKVTTIIENVPQKLYETFENNIKSKSDADILKILASKVPANKEISQCVHECLQLNGQKLIQMKDNRICKYLDEKGKLKDEDIQIVFSNLCDILYERCKEPVNKALFDDQYEDISSQITDNAHVIHQTKSRKQLLNEFMKLR